MKLNKRTKRCLKYLVKLDKEIYIRYTRIQNGESLKENSSDIISLIGSEQELIKNMNINFEKLDEIKKYFQGKLKLNLDEDLIKLSLTVDEKKYPYMRVYARIYYDCYRSRLYNGLDSKILFIDQEVLNLYRLLRNLAVDEDSLEADFCSKMVLLNSPLAEEKILINNFEPVVIYDAVEFASEIYTSMEIVLKEYENGDDINVSYERIKRATLSRKTEFDKLFHELLTLLLMNLQAHEDIYFKIFCCYFKVIFTLLDAPSREYIYECIDNSTILNNPKLNTYGFLDEFIPSLEEKIDKDLLPYIKHLSIFRF